VVDGEEDIARVVVGYLRRYDYRAMSVATGRVLFALMAADRNAGVHKTAIRLCLLVARDPLLPNSRVLAARPPP